MLYSAVALKISCRQFIDPLAVLLSVKEDNKFAPLPPPLSMNKISRFTRDLKDR